MRNQIRLQHLFREHLSSQLSEKSWRILASGLREIVQTAQPTRLTAVIRLLTEPLRRSPHANSLQLFQATLKLCGADEKIKLWPYVVNELLVEGSHKDKLIYNNLCQFAAGVSNDQMNAGLTQLSNFEAFQDHKIASDIFQAVSLNCYPLFAFLLNTEIERFVGERVLGGLRRNPRDWLIKAVAPILDLNLREHKLFLYTYLRQAPKKTLPASLKSIAAKIVTEILTTLSEERREEQWVPSTISALGQLPGPKSKEVLQQIAGAKKMLFIHQWPTPCRVAAESALAQLHG